MDATDLVRLDNPPRLPSRPADSHKGLFGHALLVGGAKGMSGALWIAGQTCLRGGAGLVTLALPESMQPSLAVAIPCAMTIGLHDSGDCETWWEQVRAPKYRNSVLAIGPGLGRSPETDAFVWKCWREWPQTALFDADALNALATAPERILENRSLTSASRILTPHPGEWARLVGGKPQSVLESRQLARDIATRCNSVIVLKGDRTWVTDGHRYFENSTGNPSLAVGGSGDALTGLITAFVCQGMDPMDAACLGVYLHGLAADLAHASLGTPSTLATDLLEYLPAAFRMSHE